MRMTRVLYSLAWPVAVAALGLGSTGCDTLRARARAQKGVEKYRDGEIAEAARLFKEAAAIDDTVPPIVLNLGFTHLQLYQQNPRSKDGAAAADLAVASFRKYMAMPGLKPEQTQRARDYLLQTFVDARRYEDAVEFFKPQVEREKPDLEALTILGNIAKSIGKATEARGWLERRVQANPKDTDGFVALAIMNWDDLCSDSQCRTPMDQRKGHLQKAPAWRFQKANEGLEFLKKAIQLSPQAPTPVTYANLLLRERSYAAASDDLKRGELSQATALMNLSIAMQKAAAGTPVAPPPSASPDGGTPGDPGLKTWAMGQTVEALAAIDTNMPPACPVPPPPDPALLKSKKPLPPPPPITVACVPEMFLGMAAPEGAAVPTAPAAPAGAPAKAATPAPAAPAPAAPAPKPAATPPAPSKPAPPKPAAAKPKPAAPAAVPASAPPPPPRPAPTAPADDEPEE